MFESLVNGGVVGKAVSPLTVDTRLALTAASGNGMTLRGVVNGDGDGATVISQPPSSCSTSPPTPNSDVKVVISSSSLFYPTLPYLWDEQPIIRTAALRPLLIQLTVKNSVIIRGRHS